MGTKTKVIFEPVMRNEKGEVDPSVPSTEELIPKKVHQDDAAFDVFAATDVTLSPFRRTIVPAGFRMQLEKGFEAQMRPRSGNSIKKGYTVLNTPGTIDAGYRGEVGVIIYNANSDADAVILKGDRIAQMVIAELPEVIAEVGKVDMNTDRGSGGFGSTGNRSLPDKENIIGASSQSLLIPRTFNARKDEMDANFGNGFILLKPIEHGIQCMLQNWGSNFITLSRSNDLDVSREIEDNVCLSKIRVALSDGKQTEYLDCNVNPIEGRFTSRSGNEKDTMRECSYTNTYLIERGVWLADKTKSKISNQLPEPNDKDFSVIQLVFDLYLVIDLSSGNFFFGVRNFRISSKFYQCDNDRLLHSASSNYIADNTNIRICKFITALEENTTKIAVNISASCNKKEK